MLLKLFKTGLILSSLSLAACAGGHLNTPTGHPFVALQRADWKQASVAIAEYNISKGRRIDVVKPNEIVLYEAVPAPDGKEQVTTKTVYTFATDNDSLFISSNRYQTDDLDDDSPSELDDQASLDAQQQELSEIAKGVSKVSSEANTERIAQPQNSQ